MTEYLCICSNAREMEYVVRALVTVLLDNGNETHFYKKVFLLDPVRKISIRFAIYEKSGPYTQGFHGTVIYGGWLERQIELGFIHNLSDIDICIKKTEAKLREEKEQKMIKSDAIIVSIDSSHGRDSTVLLVGRKRPNQSVDIINAFQGEEAIEIYDRLVTKNPSIFKSVDTIKKE